MILQRVTDIGDELREYITNWNDLLIALSELWIGLNVS